MAALFASEEEGVSLLTEEAYYAALRPNGILSAPSLMKIELDSRNSERWRSFTESETSASAVGIIPSLPLIGRASGEHKEGFRERDFFSEGFSISFEIVQGIVDRPWLDMAFIESRAYTTAHHDSGKSLDPMSEGLIKLSDGGKPPKGMLPAVPMTAYFVRNLRVRSRAFSSVSQAEWEEFQGEAGISFAGFGATGEHTSETHETNFSHASPRGLIELNGQFLIGVASRYVNKAPNPNFDDHPDADDWI